MTWTHVITLNEFIFSNYIVGVNLTMSCRVHLCVSASKGYFLCVFIHQCSYGGCSLNSWKAICWCNLDRLK